MKELNIEEKAKRYDEAIKIARQIHDADRVSGIELTTCEEIFPELAESEDEGIRKEIINYFEHYPNIIVKRERKSDYIAWLEKQCKQKHTAEEVLIKAGLKPYKDGDQWCILLGDNIQEGICGFGNTIEDALYAFLKDLITSQGEQKTADKVEPKFHEGEWVFIEEVKGYKNGPFQIKFVDSFGYSFDEYHAIPFMYEDLLSNWTINDAKDGDVLYTSSTASNEVFIFKGLTIEGYIKCYCSYDSEDKYCEGKYHFIGKPTFKTHPATKEQRDTLMKAIADAGYTFDFEKKELKKIEQKFDIEIPFGVKDSELQEASYYIPEGFHAEIESNRVVIKRGKQKPAWSEEDNKIIEEIINDIECVRAINYHAPKEGYEFRENWLKSLKVRVLPQPKQEWNQNDINMIDWLIRCCEKEHEELCNDKYGHQDIVSDLKRDCRKKWNWLESLKNKVVPQNRWKPSDEQMKQLHKYCPDNRPLTQLYQDLKKLMEK